MIQSEIEKLVQKGEGWLKEHPEKEQIIRRYLINLSSLSRQALERLSQGEEIEDATNDSVKLKLKNIKKDCMIRE
jgi:hypothetical protein